MRISVHYLTKLAFPLMLCAFALGYRMTIEDAPRAARLFPDALIWLLAAACVGEIVRASYLQWSRRNDDGDAPEITLGPAQLAVLAAMAAFYPLVLLFGFGLPSLLFLFSVSLLCGATLRQAALVTLWASLALYALVRLSGFALPLI